MSRSLLLAIVVVAAIVPDALALNFCFNPGTDSPNDSLAVAEHFKKPPPGSCSPINGFDLVRLGAPMVTGTACLNSAADTLRVAYTVSYFIHQDPGGGIVFGYPLSVYMSLPYPGGPGGVLLGGAGSTRDESGTEHGGSAHANPCNPPSPPLP
jgi:hypothetical protein